MRAKPVYPSTPIRAKPVYWHFLIRIMTVYRFAVIRAKPVYRSFLILCRQLPWDKNTAPPRPSDTRTHLRKRKRYYTLIIFTWSLYDGKNVFLFNEVCPFASRKNGSLFAIIITLASILHRAYLLCGRCCRRITIPGIRRLLHFF